MTKWTPKDKELLINLRAKNKTYAEIGKSLNRPKNSVQSMIAKMELKKKV